MPSQNNQIYGLAALTRPIFQSQNYSATVDNLYERIEQNPQDAAALLDLGILHQLMGLQEQGLSIGQDAVKIAQHFAIKHEGNAPLKLLALVCPGTFQENTPIEFLVENAAIQLDILYIMPDAPLPQIVPEHDIMMVAIGYTEQNHALLERMIPWVLAWQKPVINRPEAILNTSREALKREISDGEHVFVADIKRVDRAEIEAHFPFLIRPLDSHAGRDLEKIDDEASLENYLSRVKDDTFFLTDFVDYRSPDGLFYKLRVVLINGAPYIAHMAMNDHWMIHYLNAGMKEVASKRALEAQGMADFQSGFALRHAAAFATLHKNLGLDYVVMDCAELPDGRLFVFEADTIMIVHDMDDEIIYPYKKPAMKVLFDGFEAYVQTKV